MSPTVIQSLHEHISSVHENGDVSIQITDAFSYLNPGEAKGYELNELLSAIDGLNIKN